MKKNGIKAVAITGISIGCLESGSLVTKMHTETLGNVIAIETVTVIGKKDIMRMNKDLIKAFAITGLSMGRLDSGNLVTKMHIETIGSVIAVETDTAIGKQDTLQMSKDWIKVFVITGFSMD